MIDLSFKRHLQVALAPPASARNTTAEGVDDAACLTPSTSVPLVRLFAAESEGDLHRWVHALRQASALQQSARPLDRSTDAGAGVGAAPDGATAGERGASPTHGLAPASALSVSVVTDFVEGDTMVTLNMVCPNVSTRDDWVAAFHSLVRARWPGPRFVCVSACLGVWVYLRGKRLPDHRLLCVLCFPPSVLLSLFPRR